MAQAKVMFARFPYGASEHPKVTDWMVGTVVKAKKDGRIGEVLHMAVDDTPITMSRNRVLKAALEHGVDVVCMIDSDMQPDLPGQRPFWDTSLDFMLGHEGPCCVGAPYCGPPPHENVYVFQWARQQSDNPNVDMVLQQFGREEAMVRSGFEEVAALPTGLILIDTRGVKKLPPPWFEYEWSDPPYNTEKASTEDVFFTRNLSMLGVPQYVNWGSWAGHVKRKVVGKPTKLTVDGMRAELLDAVKKNRLNGEKLMMIGEGQKNGHAHGILPQAGKVSVR